MDSDFYPRHPLGPWKEKPLYEDKVRRSTKCGKGHWENACIHCLKELSQYQTNPVVKNYVDKVYDYSKNLHTAERFGHSLILTGPVGTGKTALGTLLLREATGYSAWALSYRATDLVRCLSNFKNYDLLPSGCPVREGVLSVQFLLLDDVDYKGDAWNAKELEEVVRHRYDDDLPTIITTNMTREQMRNVEWMNTIFGDPEKYGRERVVDVDGLNWRRSTRPKGAGRRCCSHPIRS